MVNNLPEMQAAIVQQGKEAALVGEQRPRLGSHGRGREAWGTREPEVIGSPGRAGSVSG